MTINFTPGRGNTLGTLGRSDYQKRYEAMVNIFNFPNGITTKMFIVKHQKVEGVQLHHIKKEAEKEGVNCTIKGRILTITREPVAESAAA